MRILDDVHLIGSEINLQNNGFAIAGVLRGVKRSSLQRYEVGRYSAVSSAH